MCLSCIMKKVCPTLISKLDHCFHEHEHHLRRPQVPLEYVIRVVLRQVPSCVRMLWLPSHMPTRSDKMEQRNKTTESSTVWRFMCVTRRLSLSGVPEPLSIALVYWPCGRGTEHLKLCNSRCHRQTPVIAERVRERSKPDHRDTFCGFRGGGD